MKKSKVKAAPSRVKRETKKRANTGKSAKPKAKPSPHGRKPSIAPKAARQTAKKKPSGKTAKPAKAPKVKPVSSVKPKGKPRRKPPIGKSWVYEPDKQEWLAVKLVNSNWRNEPKSATNKGGRGKVELKGQLRISQPRGKRAPLSDIREWLDKRKHVEWWRNRDGSYNALVQFYGESAYEQLSRAMRKLPLGGAYFGVRAFRTSTVEAAAKGASAGVVIGTQVLVPESSPTFNASNPDAFPLAMSHVYSAPNLYTKRAGLAIYWNKG